MGWGAGPRTSEPQGGGLPGTPAKSEMDGGEAAPEPPDTLRGHRGRTREGRGSPGGARSPQAAGSRASGSRPGSLSRAHGPRAGSPRRHPDRGSRAPLTWPGCSPCSEDAILVRPDESIAAARGFSLPARLK